MLAIDGVSVFALAKTRMRMLDLRQRTLAENVANVSTPRYTPRDVDMDDFARALRDRFGSVPMMATAVAPNRTHDSHLDGSLPPPRVVALKKAPDSETTLDGNAVVVEEQMARLAHTRMEFETLIGLYRKSLSMLRMSARDPLS